MRSGLTKPILLKKQLRKVLAKKVFNVILVKEERPPLQKSVAWLITTDRARPPDQTSSWSFILPPPPLQSMCRPEMGKVGAAAGWS